MKKAKGGYIQGQREYIPLTETAKRQIKTHLGILNNRKKKEKQCKCQELLLCGKIQDPFAFPTSEQLPPEQSKV